ncbi:MAG: CopG family transcriptional regulator [Rhizobiaceae bacterium]|nr:CopG family transcriptional regulator [Rhizobiaceae bacterium]
MPQDLAAQLEHMAGHVGDIPRADIQVVLRRAALMIRNASPIGLDVDCEDAVRAISGELNMTRNDMIRRIVKEWLETNAYLPVRFLDEDGAVEGSA